MFSEFTSVLVFSVISFARALVWSETHRAILRESQGGCKGPALMDRDAWAGPRVIQADLICSIDPEHRNWYDGPLHAAQVWMAGLPYSSAAKNRAIHLGHTRTPLSWATILFRPPLLVFFWLVSFFPSPVAPPVLNPSHHIRAPWQGRVAGRALPPGTSSLLKSFSTISAGPLLSSLTPFYPFSSPPFMRTLAPTLLC